jgi:hypothetical protein
VSGSHWVLFGPGFVAVNGCMHSCPFFVLLRRIQLRRNSTDSEWKHRTYVVFTILGSLAGLAYEGSARRTA